MALIKRFIALILFLVFLTRPVFAFTPPAISAQTDEEALAVSQLLKSRDEFEITGYLGNNSASIRAAACKRLGALGTTYSLADLELLANNDTDPQVKDEAALSLWKTRYRVAPTQEAKEDVALQALGLSFSTTNLMVDFSALPVPFTPDDDAGVWSVAGGKYQMRAEDYEKHISVMDGPYIIKGNAGVKFTLSQPYPGTPVEGDFIFGLDEDGNSYSLMFVQLDSKLSLRLYDPQGENIFSHDFTGASYASGIEHSVSVSLDNNTADNSCDLFIDLDATRIFSDMMPHPIVGGLALAARYYTSSGDFAVFDDCSVTAESVVAHDTADITKTPDVRAWAMNILGDQASVNAIPLLKLFSYNIEPAHYNDYFKEVAEDNLKKINFILVDSRFPGDANMDRKVDLEDLVALAKNFGQSGKSWGDGDFTGDGKVDLSDLIALASHYNHTINIWELAFNSPYPCVRDWGIRKLQETNPADIQTQLENLLQIAIADGDENSAIAIGLVKDKVEDRLLRPPIEIDYPGEGEVIKSPTVTVVGSTYEDSFTEDINLAPGVNTYSKSVLDEEGRPISKTITFYFNNSPPAISPISDIAASVGQAVNFTVSATDADDAPEELIYFAKGLPSGAAFNQETRLFSWEPNAPGAYVLKFTVLDPYDLSADREVTITVNPAPLPQITSISPSSAKGGDTVTITGSNFSVYLGASNYNPEADFNFDGKIDLEDLTGLARNFGGSGKTHDEGDTNNDGKVNLVDLCTLAVAFNTNHGSTYVEFANQAIAKIISWSDTRIVCKVPYPAASGQVSVVNHSGRSNSVNFTKTQN